MTRYNISEGLNLKPRGFQCACSWLE